MKRKRQREAMGGSASLVLYYLIGYASKQRESQCDSGIGLSGDMHAAGHGP